MFFLIPSFWRKLKIFFSAYFIILIVLFLVGSIVVFPGESVEAAYQGLMVWFTIVLPALLPFFIGSELLMGLGVVKFIGVLLEPLMRPLFNVPGEGSFAFAMSVASGYPVGVRIVSKMRSDKHLTLSESHRLISFCSTSGPLFIIGAVAAGMFKSPEAGILLASAHYTAAVIVGVFFRFYDKSSDRKSIVKKKENLFQKAFCQLRKSRKEAPSFGILMGNAVKESFNTLLMIGGFIVLFSVIINIMQLLGITSFIAHALQPVLKILGFNLVLTESLITGIFEITIGSKMAAEAYGTTLITRIAAAAFIIGWSGLSIHAQTVSIISTTDINISFYIFSKLLHGILSFFLVFILHPIIGLFLPFSVSVFNYYDDFSATEKMFHYFKVSIEFFIIIIMAMLFITLLVLIITAFKNYISKKRNCC